LNKLTQTRLRRILSGAAVLAVILALSLLGLRPPRAGPADAPATQFSATRALNALRRVLTDDTPHPIGSAANDAVRVRIMAELARLGYQPEVRTAFQCSGSGVCATVNNVVARIEGTQPGDAVLLSAHYDSVPAGPGDSDDGVGVAAVLEIARALKAMPPPRHSIVLLLDDGEEAGLLGAQAFLNSGPMAMQVRADVNLDDRGTSGPSLLFETGPANNWAVRVYARHAARHIASSIFYTVYKQLPNDTDFTVFKSAGYEGFNFAFVGHEALYHTPLDNSANVSVASLQDQGDNGLASIVALANANLLSLPHSDAVYFDLFGRKIVHWPGRWTLALALLALLLLAAQSAWLVRKNRLKSRELLWGLIGWPAILAVTGVADLVLRVFLAIVGATPVAWIAHPRPAEIAFALLGIATTVAVGSFIANSAGFWGLWSGAWAWMAVLSVPIGAHSPGLSYVVLVPALVAGVAALPAILTGDQNTWARDAAIILPLVASAIVLIPVMLLGYSALGNQSLVGIALAVVFLVTPLLPLCVDLRQWRGLGGVAMRWSPLLAVALATFVAAVVPAYSAKSPERVNFDYALDADTGMARWIVYPDSGRLPEPIRLAAAFRHADRGAFPWDPQISFIANAPHLDLAAPTFTILQSSLAGNQRSYTALLRSERGAPAAAVLFPPGSDVASVRIEGQSLEPQAPRRLQYTNGWTAYSCPDIPAAGINISFTLPMGHTVEVFAVDRSYGLPSVGSFLANARPLTATPSQNGDVTLVTRRVQLFP
jgi:MFS family permease